MKSHKSAGALAGVALACQSSQQYEKVFSALHRYLEIEKVIGRFEKYDIKLFAFAMTEHIDSSSKQWRNIFQKEPDQYNKICIAGTFAQANMGTFGRCIERGDVRDCLY